MRWGGCARALNPGVLICLFLSTAPTCAHCVIARAYGHVHTLVAHHGCHTGAVLKHLRSCAWAVRENAPIWHVIDEIASPARSDELCSRFRGGSVGGRVRAGARGVLHGSGLPALHEHGVLQRERRGHAARELRCVACDWRARGSGRWPDAAMWPLRAQWTGIRCWRRSSRATRRLISGCSRSAGRTRCVCAHPAPT